MKEAGHGRAAYRALGLALALLALAGCGGGGDEAAAPETAITVREFDGETLTRTIPLDDCGEANGACDRVIDVLPRLAPDPEEVCTQIYGGPERRVVTGVIDGIAVGVEVTRADGCQMARYDLLTKALAG